MNLYKISQGTNDDYDTYDSAVVCAESEEARNMHPDGSEIDWEKQDENFWKFRAWVTNPDDVTVDLIGKALCGPKRVICASYHAG